MRGVSPHSPTSAPADVASPSPRRHRTRQRARLLELLRATDAHPTAAELFDQLRPELPNLSLGTVYRNLEVLVSEGLAEKVASPGRAVRYDGNPEPHHHFVCEACGAIRDVDVSVPPQLQTSLRRRHRLRASRLRIDFYGCCESCSD